MCKKEYTQAIDTGWVMREYGGGTKSALLASSEWALPPLLTMCDGTPVTKERWQTRRAELLDILMEYGFGYTPAAPDKVDAEILWTSADKTYAGTLKSYAGKAVSERIEISFDAPYGRFSFPIQFIRPAYVKNPPVIIHLAFDPSLRDCPLSAGVDTNYAPIEEIIDNGFAYVHLCYNDIIGDTVRGAANGCPSGDYVATFVKNGMGAVFCRGETRGKSEWGKVGMWAYGASRVVDYLMTRDDIDKNCICVAGHSRLGKTALWCGCQDERIFATLANCSGFGGAGLMKGLSRDKIALAVTDGRIDWWCARMADFAHDPTALPYDAHFMVAAVAPRYVNLVAADGDMARYQLADFMSAAAASEAYEVQGLAGFVSDDALPHPTVVYNEGHIGYALRPGSHYFSRWDWNRHMEFVKKHRN